MIVCKFCHESTGEITKASWIAPQFVGGDENGHVEYHPVCKDHFSGWWDGIPPERQLSAFVIPETEHDKHPDTSLLEYETV